MTEEIIELLDDLGRRFGVAIDWTSQNVMPYMEELAGKVVSYKIVSTVFLMATLLMIIAGLILFVVVTKKKDTFIETDWRGRKEMSITGEILHMIALIVAPILFIVFLTYIDDLIKYIMLPELTIINTIKSLL